MKNNKLKHWSLFFFIYFALVGLSFAEFQSYSQDSLAKAQQEGKTIVVDVFANW